MNKILFFFKTNIIFILFKNENNIYFFFLILLPILTFQLNIKSFHLYFKALVFFLFIVFMISLNNPKEKNNINLIINKIITR